MGVHDRRDSIVVDVTIACGDVLDNRNALLFSLVRKHWTECAIADDPDVWYLCPELLIDNQPSSIVCF